MTEVLSGLGGPGASEASVGPGSAGALFAAAAAEIADLNTNDGLERPGVSFGRMEARNLFEGVQKRYGVELVAGFEDNPRVSGGVLRGSKVFEKERDDALVLLEFGAGAVDLPLHVHKESARFIVVGKGCGFFYYVAQKGGKVRTRSVRKGDTIVFLRGVIHTLTAPRTALRLLSYHTPFFELGDPRQWSLPHEAKLLQPLLDGFHVRRSPRRSPLAGVDDSR